jgi:hypothetical protein
MDILFAPDAFYLDRLLFKPIFDSEIETDIPLNSFTIRKCGVQFGELSSRQRSRLDYFISNHTIGKADFNPALQPWDAGEMVPYNASEIVESII